jgi:hypothetical protein
MPLTDQEIRHATYTGKFIKLMEKLAEDDWWLENKIVTVRQVRRMEDVEFVSELFVATIAGPQNKKDTLEEYFVDYEHDMPDATKWSERFEGTRDLIAQVLSRDDVRSWSGKSDFYSLFLLFSGLVDDGRKLSAAKRTALRAALMKFRKQVDDAKKRGSKAASGAVGEYVEAVTRAASDQARRASRLEILEKLARSAL